MFNYTFPSAISADARTELLKSWQSFAVNAPSDLALRVFTVIDAANLIDTTQNFILEGVYWGGRKDFDRDIAPLIKTFPKDVRKFVLETNYMNALRETADEENFDVQLPNNVLPPTTFYTKSLVAPERLTSKTIANFVNFLSSPDSNIPSATSPGAPVVWYVIIDLYGGRHSRISQLPRSSASYDGRDTLFTFQFFSGPWTFAPPYPDAGYEFMDRMVASITDVQPQTKFRAYINYVDDRYTAKEAHELYYGVQYPRLAKIKRKWDPRGIFWNPYAVGEGDA